MIGWWMFAEPGVRRAQLATKVLFGEDLSNVSGSDIVSAFEHDPTRMVKVDRTQVVNCYLDSVAALSKATRSKCKQPSSLTPAQKSLVNKTIAEAQKLAKTGGIYLNNKRITNPRHVITEADLIDGHVCVIRTGKSSYHIVHAM